MVGRGWSRAGLTILILCVVGLVLVALDNFSGEGGDTGEKVLEKPLDNFSGEGGDTGEKVLEKPLDESSGEGGDTGEKACEPPLDEQVEETVISSRIAFTRYGSYGSIDGDIFAVDVASGDLQQLTHQGRVEGSPAWSPDGTRVTFISGNAVFIVDADGANRRQVTDHDFVGLFPVLSAAAWSPDGSRLAFTAGWSGDSAVYVMDADGSNFQQITDRFAESGSPAWSPDGSRLAFTGDPGYEAVGSSDTTRINGRLVNISRSFATSFAPVAIYVVDADGGNLRKLHNGFDPVWSPDGSRLAFTSEAGIVVVDADGSNLQAPTGKFALFSKRVLPSVEGSVVVEAAGIDPEVVRFFGPRWSPGGTHILFAADRDGDYDIFVMDAGGTQVQQLTDNDYNDWYPAWSADGAQITFTSIGEDGGVFLMDADGANLRQLTHNDRWDWGVVWSPDGTRIAFNRRFAPQLFVMDADGGDAQQLTDGISGQSPAWSPNGAQIAFIRYGEVFVVGADDATSRRITDNDHWDVAPAWSPDGTRIAFGGDGEVFVVGADGTNPEQLTSEGLGYVKPLWSPDCSQILFAAYRNGENEVLVLDADGSNLRRLAGGHAPVWSPDGGQIAFIVDRDGAHDISMMDIDGTNVRQLTNDSYWKYGLRWSPDGSQIVYSIDPDGAGSNEVHVVGADGSNPRRLSDGHGPEWSPDGSRIVFHSNRDGDDEIFVMNSDGRDVQQLTENHYQDRFPVWAPG